MHTGSTTIFGNEDLDKAFTSSFGNEYTTTVPPSKSETVNPPQVTGGMTGWICPVCGRGLSPFTNVCPCKPWPKMEVTC